MTRPKFWPTHKIESVLNSPLIAGVDGKDFGPYEQELREELYSRLDKQTKEQNTIDERQWQAFEDYCATRRWELRNEIKHYREIGTLTLETAQKLKRDIELITGEEVCPFIWAIYVNNNNKETLDAF